MKRASGVAALLAVLCLLLTGCAEPPPPDPASITAAQRRAATEEDLAMRWEQVQPGDPTFARPVVHIVRYVNYLDEGQVLATCMHTAGYPHVTWTFGGGLVDTDLKPVDRFPVEVAIYICEAKYPPDPLELGYLSDAQEAYLYEYWSNDTVPCMRERGAVLSDLPPIGQFGEGYEDVAALNPYQHAKYPNGVKQSYLVTVCPPYPGEVYAAHK
jgi:hypothetical protein